LYEVTDNLLNGKYFLQFNNGINNYVVHIITFFTEKSS